MVTILYKWFLLSTFHLLLPAKNENVTANKKPFHPFYIAVTEINQNAKDKTLEISCKMFAEDFEKVLETNYKASLNIGSQKDKTNFDKLIPDYMAKHLLLAADGKALKLSYVGYELEKESVYCYLEVENISSLKKLDITNSILQDFTKEQINIIHVAVNGNRQS